MCAAPALETHDQIGPAMRTRLAGFLRSARDSGFKIGLAEARDAALLLSAEQGQQERFLKPAMKALLCGRQSDWQRFDELFNAYWSHKGLKQGTKVTGEAPPKANVPNIKQLFDAAQAQQDTGMVSDVDRMPADDEDGKDPSEDEATSRKEGASRAENLEEIDFRKLKDPALEAEAHALAERLARSMRTRLTRRDRERRKGLRLDLRKTIARSIATGGTPLDLVKKGPKEKQLRLVILLDASGSMSNYTGTFIRFVHGLLDNFREAEAFLFHTRLVHVSSAMAERDAARALDRLGLMAQGVGGGTRIGHALADFNRWHAARVIHSRTCVIILSDGYDTEAPEQLGVEMARLKKRCKRIVWLNPLIGWEDYEPTAGGMAAALPHIDLFAPAHNLKSLAKLEPYLATL